MKGAVSSIQHVRSVLRRSAAEHWQVLRTHVRNRSRFNAVANPYKVLYVNPEAVRTRIRSRRGWDWAPGTIEAGDWDRNTLSFLESPKYLGLVERFELGMPWEETVLFREKFAERLERDGSVLGMDSLEALIRYYEKRIDPLYEAIQRSGFSPPSLWRRGQPVHVLIARDGELIWGLGGNHRLAIAKILRLDSVPTRVGVRHLEWQEVREEARSSGGSAIKPELRSHADLLDLLPSHTNTAGE
jgi:hypothetical protein